MRYQVVTYSSDIGEDEKRDFPNKRAAVASAKAYLAEEESSAVYDTQQRRFIAIFGDRWWFERENERLAVKYA